MLETEQFLFDIPEYKIKKPIRLIELFAGVGSQNMALRNIGANYESYKVVEFDQYAINSYNAIHKTHYPALDITKIKGADLEIKERDKYEYILFYSFPCTDLSLAGKCAGMKKGSGTRSGLLWEVERLLNELGDDLPQVLIMENVTQVHSIKNIDDFNSWLNFLSSKGFKSFYQDINARDYIPQNRDRTFVISILTKNEINYTFPKGNNNETIRDYLEAEPVQKLDLSEEKKAQLFNSLSEEKKAQLLCRYRKSLNGKFISHDNAYIDIINRKCASTIDTRATGLTVFDRKPECINLYKKDGKETSLQDRVFKSDNVAAAICTAFQPGYLVENLRIRKLSAREAWRLMGFLDSDYDAAAKVNSKSQLYKQAGNSIVVPVLEAIFKQLIS